MNNTTLTIHYKSVFIASDHAGFIMKAQLIKNITKYSDTIIDLGSYNNLYAADYPEYALKLIKKMQEEVSHNTNQSAKLQTIGILICGSGIGMSIAANRFNFIRAALCPTIKYAKLARKHNNANVLVLGERTISIKKAIKIADTFFNTTFLQEERYERRIEQLTKLAIETN